MASRFKILIRSLLRGQWHLLGALPLTFVVGTCLPVADDASAKAPPLATSVLGAEALTAPGFPAAPVAVIPWGAEVELTGEASPGLLGVYYDGQAVWVPAQYLTLRDRPGIDASVTVVDGPLLDAPLPDASVLEIILEGQAIILTGASIGGHDVASYDGSGGWVVERELPQ